MPPVDLAPRRRIVSHSGSPKRTARPVGDQRDPFAQAPLMIWKAIGDRGAGVDVVRAQDVQGGSRGERRLARCARSRDGPDPDRGPGLSRSGSDRPASPEFASTARSRRRPPDRRHPAASRARSHSDAAFTPRSHSSHRSVTRRTPRSGSSRRYRVWPSPRCSRRRSRWVASSACFAKPASML